MAWTWSIFFDEYELAHWWAETKTAVQNKKYSRDDKACVIEAEILYGKSIDLDTIKGRNSFFSFWKQYEKGKFDKKRNCAGFLYGG